MFGCCSRFVECSDARKCVHENKLFSMACHYRHNLDNGRIFYGKNKNVDEKGNLTHIVDNGVMSRVVSKKANGEATASYSFNRHVRAFSSQSKLIDEEGQFVDIIDENEAMWGFEEYDRRLHALQVDTGNKQSFDISHLRPIDVAQGSQNLTNAQGASSTTSAS